MVVHGGGGCQGWRSKVGIHQLASQEGGSRLPVTVSCLVSRAPVWVSGTGRFLGMSLEMWGFAVDIWNLLTLV